MKEILRLTENLIRFRSVRGNHSDMIRCADYIEAYLDTHGIAYQRQDYNRVLSFLVLPKSNRVKVLLMSHFDVVDGPDKLSSPVIRDGRLYGRGSIDDKYAVALSLVLMKNHVMRRKASSKKCNEKDTFGLLITGDEESGGIDGAKRLLPQIQTQFAIALDGGYPDGIVVKEKGLITLKLVAQGTATHGARPWLGSNSIDNLIDDYRAINPLFIQTQGKPDHWYRTCNIATIKGGLAHNQVPECAEATLDIRYTEEDDVASLIENIRAAMQGKLQVLRKEPLFMGGGSPYLDLLLKHFPSIETICEHGASDARFLSDNAIPGIVWGADGEFSQHSENEHASIESIATLAKRLEIFLDEVTHFGSPISNHCDLPQATPEV
jgi:succinyl-diaminopimelate desuccinylase